MDPSQCVTEKDPRFLLWPPAAKQALSRPSRLHPGTNATLWDDIREVLLDPAPDPASAESIHRWLRDQIQADLESMLSRGNPRSLTLWAARLAPRMLWHLPCSLAPPPPHSHRRIVAILLPHKLRLLKQELTRLAFIWGLRENRE